MLSTNEVINTNNCYISVCKSKFTVTKLSGYKSFFFGGEGVFMKFKGPCELYVQNRNINDFIRQIDNRLPARTNISLT